MIHNEKGNLSVDFLAGFTIFILAFIWVATMIPSLLVGLNAHSIDYNAVAYRTSVILAEDPGAAGPVSGAPCFGISSASGSVWESTVTAPTKCDIARFGLAVSKDTPNVLDENKVNRFFCWTESADPNDKTNLSYPDDYRKRAIFGDYPYRFNISLRIDGENTTRYVGDAIPEQDYGYIRRAVLVKGPSNATIDENLIKEKYWSNGTVMQGNYSEDRFTIHFNSTKLLKDSKITPHDINYRNYQIDPGLDTIVINITGLDTIYYPNSTTTTNLSGINLYRSLGPPPQPLGWFNDKNMFTYIDGNSTPVGTLPANVTSNISLVIPSGAVISETILKTNPHVYLTLIFKNTNTVPTINNTYGNWYINSSESGPFEYDDNPVNVTQPQLHSGVLEVAVW